MSNQKEELGLYRPASTIISHPSDAALVTASISWLGYHSNACAHQHSILTGSDPKAPKPHSFCVDLVQVDLWKHVPADQMRKQTVRLGDREASPT